MLSILVTIGGRHEFFGSTKTERKKMLLHMYYLLVTHLHFNY